MAKIDQLLNKQLKTARHEMKHMLQTKKEQKREFEIGDSVYLKLQPYK
jgi:hypothetical protein